MKIFNIKKKYIFLSITIIYFVAKIYVIYTPNTNDDDIPDKFKNAALRIFQVNDEMVLGYTEDYVIQT